MLSKTTLLFVRRDEYPWRRSTASLGYSQNRINSWASCSSSWSREEFSSCSNFSCCEKSLHKITSWSIFFELVKTLEVRRIGNRKKEPDKTCWSVVGKLVGELLLSRSCCWRTSWNWGNRALLEITLSLKSRSCRWRTCRARTLAFVEIAILLSSR